MALHAFFWHAVLPQFEVITLAHLREQSKVRYTQLRLWGSVGFIVAVIGLGWLFEVLSLTLYPWMLLVIIAGIALSSCWVPDAQPVHAPLVVERGGFIRRVTPARRAGFLPVCGAYAAVPWAVLQSLLAFT